MSLIDSKLSGMRRYIRNTVGGFK